MRYDLFVVKLGVHTFPCDLSGSNRDPGSGLSSGELYLPVKRPPPTGRDSESAPAGFESLQEETLTRVKLVETDAELAQAREQLRLDRPMDCVVDTLICRGLDISVGLAYPHNLSDFPAVKQPNQKPTGTLN